MRRLVSVAIVLAVGALATAQAPDKELVATISGPALAGGIVAGLGWNGGVLIIQTAAQEKDGTIAARYLVVAGRRMEVRPDPSAAPGFNKYWRMKSNRVSPTGLGKIITGSDSKLPMYGVASQEKRLLDAMDMGGVRITHEVRLGGLVLHKRTEPIEPYDGEIWSWSPAEINRIAYVDEKGDVWIARADGQDAERVLKGKFTLPAWSEDGTVLAVAERRDNGGKWEISVIHLPEKYRR